MALSATVPHHFPLLTLSRRLTLVVEVKYDISFLLESLCRLCLSMMIPTVYQHLK